MLASDGVALHHPRGLNNRFVYFYYRNFLSMVRMSYGKPEPISLNYTRTMAERSF
jgi:hypothetical protein